MISASLIVTWFVLVALLVLGWAHESAIARTGREMAVIAAKGGVPGPPGERGSPGDPGPRGEQGIPGVPGERGSQGEPGRPGDPGSVGPRGEQGIQGLPGAMGPAGIQGNIGPIGPRGDIGLTGATGAIGLTGPQGLKGDTGSVGATGGIGPQGLQGLKGDVGATGSIGPQGLKGDVGATGSIGPQGLKGDTGSVGATGSIGPQGLQGFKGDVGATGSQGPIGATGSQGPIGATGSIGPQGLQGFKGDVGATGSQGPIGATGSIGPQGLQGLKGDVGATGSQGPIGATGSQGPIGATGSQGPKGDTGPAAYNPEDFPKFIGMFAWETDFCMGNASFLGCTSPVPLKYDSGYNNINPIIALAKARGHRYIAMASDLAVTFNDLNEAAKIPDETNQGMRCFDDPTKTCGCGYPNSCKFVWATQGLPSPAPNSRWAVYQVLPTYTQSGVPATQQTRYFEFQHVWGNCLDGNGSMYRNPCNPTNTYQNFSFEPSNAAGYFMMRSRANGKCVANSGSVLQQQDCNPANQAQQIKYVDGKLKTANGGCITGGRNNEAFWAPCGFEESTWNMAMVKT
jgi:collagen triple helix repeat protein